MKYNINRLFQFLAVGVLSVSLLASAKAQITIVDNGKSTFSVIIPGDAPESVKSAAQELQKDVELATGAKLSIKTHGEVGTPFISLGGTEQAKAVGLDGTKLADDTFRIVTRSGNLYIVGADTPDGGWTQLGGVSNGTANGVYTFLEDYLGVRWLMPGEIGRDVPKKSTLVIEDIDRTVTPAFHMRTMRYLENYANRSQHSSIRAWMDHQRMGNIFSGSFGHAWWSTINSGFGGKDRGVNTDAVRKAHEAHPEWFAMNENGERPLPRNEYAKLETTNPELVKWFAEQKIKEMKAASRPRGYSLSPSDGSSTWSQSPESKALYDPPQGGNDPETASGKPGVSSLTLKWYHDIAAIVEKEYPEGRLHGFLYSSYVYPPTKISAKLPKNFVAQIAPSRNYGYGLYREDVQEYFYRLTDEWSKIISSDWYYYDLPANLLRQKHAATGRDKNFHGAVGLIMPVAPDIYNIIFPQLVKSRIKGGLLYGITPWDSAAISNYIMAQMMWDPELDAQELQREWLERAYGPKAGAAMDKFYTTLDNKWREYYIENEDFHYELDLVVMKEFFAATYPELEKLFLEAKSQPMNDIQRQRFKLIEDNFIVLQWRLRNEGFLLPNFSSSLQRSDAEISEIVGQDNPAFPRFPGIAHMRAKNDKPAPLPWKVAYTGAAIKSKERVSPKWDDSQFLIHARESGDIRISVQTVRHSAYFEGYEVRDSKGKHLTSGVFSTEKPIVFPAKAGESYILSMPLRKTAKFQLLVEDAVIAKGNLQDGTLELAGKAAPVYVHYISGKSNAGIFEADNGVSIRMPYSGNIAEKYMDRMYQNGRILYSFDDNWLFQTDPQNDGLERGVTKLDFDDTDWAPISTTNWWQMQGHDYHGAAWYRIKFNGKSYDKGDKVRLFFGGVDGHAEVYLNGKKITKHKIGPAPTYKGWDSQFTRTINGSLNSEGENILAVKVTSKNETSASGIFKGVVVLTGKWKQ